jgi:hypothetical protein
MGRALEVEPHQSAAARSALVDNYIQELPKANHERPEWRAAIEALLLMVECDGDTLLAYIGIKQALNAGKQLEPAPRRKRPKKHRIIR